MSDPKHGPYDDHWFAVAALTQDTQGVEMDVACVDGWERARQWIGDQVPGIITPEWWQFESTISGCREERRPKRYDVFRHVGIVRDSHNKSTERDQVKAYVLAARVRGVVDITDWLPITVNKADDPLTITLKTAHAATAMEEHEALKRLCYQVLYEHHVTVKGPERVQLLAQMIVDMRKNDRELRLKVKALEAEAEHRDEARIDKPCTMSGRLDLGHGKNGFCVLTNSLCPRACLRKQIESQEAALRGAASSADGLIRESRQLSAAVALITDEARPGSEGTMAAVGKRLTPAAIKTYILDEIVEDRHGFVRGDGTKGPADETCALCGHDPRNVVHDPVSAVDREVTEACSYAIEKFASWVLTGERR